LELLYRSTGYNNWHDSFTYIGIGSRKSYDSLTLLIGVKMINEDTTEILSIKNKSLGKVFKDRIRYSFHHIPTDTLKTGFFDFEDALNAWYGFHDEWFENQ